MESIEVEVRVGTQTNCGGFTIIKMKLDDEEAAQSLVLVNRAANIPDEYLQAIWSGAREAFDELKGSPKLRLTLLEALVHPVDANQRVFREAGYKAARKCISQLGK